MTLQLPVMRRSATLVQQALVFGSVRDSLTPTIGPRGGLTVRLIDRDTSANYPLAGKVMPDATYAFYGLPQTAFPLLATQTYHLRVEASAPGYITASSDFDLGRDATQPAPTDRPFAALPGVPTIHVPLFTNLLPREVNLRLNREAVRLGGRVVRVDNPMQGISGTSVQANGQTKVTDGQGFYRFDNPLPVVLSLIVTVAAATFDLATLTYEPDYRTPINDLVIALKKT